MIIKFPSLKKIMANFAVRVQRVISILKGESDALLAENADLRERLAAALASDVADAAAVAAAQEEAATARAAADAAAAESVRLQGLVDADVAEDAALEEVLRSVEALHEEPAAPAEEVVVEEAPATEEVTE
jgi:hypothetical protein